MEKFLRRPDPVRGIEASLSGAISLHDDGGLIMKLRLFWVFFGIDVLICIIVVGFFFIGLIDGSVSSFNFGIWITIWAALAVIVAGSLWLKMLGYPVFGTILLLVLAVPGLICGLILFLTIVTNTSWI